MLKLTSLTVTTQLNWLVKAAHLLGILGQFVAGVRLAGLIKLGFDIITGEEAQFRPLAVMPFEFLGLKSTVLTPPS